MKAKKIFVMFATVGMMLAPSCSNDEVLELFDKEALVTFSLGIENAISTRAISDGTGVKKLIYAVFDSEGNRVVKSDASATFPFEKTFYLIKGEQYTAVFWAQNRDCNAYSISDDYKTITVDYDEALNNDENRDAFFRAETFTATDGANINVVLKRPFAQVNLGITQAEWENAKNAGFEITQSSVEIKQAATTLNLIDGSVGNAKDITFRSNTIPANDEILKVDLNCDGKAEEYKYLSMCYFLANDAVNGASQTTLDGLKFTLTCKDESKNIILTTGLDNAPVQRNYRTNIVGNGGGSILTSDIDVKVSLDPLYDGEHTFDNHYVWEEYAGIYTEEALAGQTIEIPKGWHIRNGYILEPIPEFWTADSKPLYAKPYTIDGKDHTITFDPYNYSFVTKNAFAAADGKLVTVKNLIFKGEHFGFFGGVYGGVEGRTDYNTQLENVKIEGNGIYCYNDAGSIPMSVFSNLGTATLNNCTIKGTYWVGAKDENMNAKACYDKFGIYDIFVPDNKLTHVNKSIIGSIYVSNHGHLTISGTSTIDKIDAFPLVNGAVTIENGAKVKLLNVTDYTNSYPPNITIMDDATIETLDLNTIANTKNINIDDGATISKIKHKGAEYNSIEAFKNSLKKP